MHLRGRFLAATIALLLCGATAHADAVFVASGDQGELRPDAGGLFRSGVDNPFSGYPGARAQATQLTPETATVDWRLFRPRNDDPNAVVKKGKLNLSSTDLYMDVVLARRGSGSLSPRTAVDLSTVANATEWQASRLDGVAGGSYVPTTGLDFDEISRTSFMFAFGLEQRPGRSEKLVIQAIPNPEPGAIALFALGALGLAVFVLRRRRDRGFVPTAG